MDIEGSLPWHPRQLSCSAGISASAGDARSATASASMSLFVMVDPSSRSEGPGS